MAQSGFILALLLLLSIAAIGQCITPTQCTQDSDVKYYATKDPPSGANWGPDLQTTTTDFVTTDRKEDCRSICERKCRGGSWSGCVTFSSEIDKGYSNQCWCYGYSSAPSFGDDVKMSEANFLSGQCVTGWFETDTM